MAGIMKAMSTLLLAAVIMTAAPPRCEAAVSCSTVASYLASCVSYVTDTGPLTPSCCHGIENLNSAAATPADRQTTCNCLKMMSGQYSGIDYHRVNGVPGECHVRLPYDINPSIDCSKVQ